MIRRSVPLFLAVVTLITACGENSGNQTDEALVSEPFGVSVFRDTMPPPDPIGITFGSSFGECFGYCKREYTFHSWGVSGIRKAWPTERPKKPEQRIWVRISKERLTALTSMVDTMSLGEPYEVIGCGDCKDGGGCWLNIERLGKSKVLSYECVDGAGELQPLMVLLYSLVPVPPENASGLAMPGLPHWE